MTNFLKNLILKPKINNEKVIQIEPINTNGSKLALIGNYRLNTQSKINNRNLIGSINAIGSKLAIQTNHIFGKNRFIQINKNLFKSSIWLTNYLGTGQQLTSLENKKSKSLQKSLLTTYYLGEKTVNINSTIQNDSKILSQIKNTLSVDLFHYLNQSIQRSDALDDYLNLLEVALEKAAKRSGELNAQINFLTDNSNAKLNEIKISEETFFKNMKIFDGPNAEQELYRFIELRDSQNEIKAKLGLYKSLKGYYDFFNPQIANLIKEIKLNREAIIAGVRVTEIRNMQLPLIIKP